MNVVARRSNVRCLSLDCIYPGLCTGEKTLTFSFYCINSHILLQKQFCFLCSPHQPASVSQHPKHSQKWWASTQRRAGTASKEALLRHLWKQQETPATRLPAPAWQWHWVTKHTKPIFLVKCLILHLQSWIKLHLAEKNLAWFCRCRWSWVTLKKEHKCGKISLFTCILSTVDFGHLLLFIWVYPGYPWPQPRHYCSACLWCKACLFLATFHFCCKVLSSLFSPGCERGFFHRGDIQLKLTFAQRAFLLRYSTQVLECLRLLIQSEVLDWCDYIILFLSLIFL